MKFLLSIPVMMRAVVVLFMAGFVLGISLGYQLGDSADKAIPLSPSPSADSTSLSLVSPNAGEVEQPCTPTPWSC
ncbi:MAG: hypothetical protein ABIQ18_31160 [Umezawaea sp.]